MSSGFSFGQKPNETPTFGQSSFGNPQVGGPVATTAQAQFSLPFGAKTSVGGFPFSAPTTTPAFGNSLNFNPATTQQNANPGTNLLGFGTSTAPTFGLGSTSTAFSFSTPSSTPQTTNLFGTGTSGLTNFALGAPKTTAPTFGTSNVGLFGTIASTTPGTQTAGFGIPSSTTISFGTAQPGLSAGFGSSVPGGFSLAPAITTAASTATAQPTGLSFGVTTSLAPPATKLSFGQNTTTPALSLGFGAPQSTPLTSLNFQPASTSIPQIGGLTFPAPASTVPAFGTPTSITTPSLGLSFGAPAPSAAKISFSTPPAATLASTITPSTGLTFAAPSSVPTTTLNFLPPTSTATSLGLAPSVGATTTTTAATAGLSFLTTSTVPTTTTSFGLTTTSSGTVTTASAVPTLSFGSIGTSTNTLNFGTPTTTTSALLNFGATLPTITESPSVSGSTAVGLGGIKATASGVTGLPAPAQTLSGTSKPPDLSQIKTTSDGSATAPKDQLLPNELMQTVENFKKFVKEQKGYSSEISRFSIKDLRKVEQDIDLINNCMNDVENQLRKNKAIVDKLKLDTAKDLQNAEMAQRTFDTPAGLQYENTAPFNYFVELSDNFETGMHDLKIHIENVAKYIRNSGAPTTLSPEDLALGMRRLHESFVALAGRLQSVHSQVELQKEQYLSVRRKMLNDYTNVFEKKHKESDALELVLEKLAKQQPAITNSPTPFTSLRSSQVQAVGQNNTTIGYPTVPTLGPPLATGFNISGTPNISFFGSNITNTPPSNSFQLQKPPVGNKRGKP